MKKCFKCLSIKPLTDFYKHSEMADGHVNKCKECNKNDVIENREKRLYYYRDYDRKRGNRQTPEYKKNYSEKYPNKRKAHHIVNNAIRSKKLFKEPCEICGSFYRPHAHHDDYSKPLEVRWLCDPHHRKLHRLARLKRRAI